MPVMTEPRGIQGGRLLGGRARARAFMSIPAARSSRFFCRLASRRASSSCFSRALRFAFFPLRASELAGHCHASHCITLTCPRARPPKPLSQVRMHTQPHISGDEMLARS